MANTPLAPLTLNKETVALLYVVYYGRPPDYSGLEFWTGKVDESGFSYSPRSGDVLTDSERPLYERIVDDFGRGAEYEALFRNTDNTQKVDKIYQYCFGRNSEIDPLLGENYWVGKLNRGEITLSQIAVEIALGAQGADLEFLSNRLKSASLFIEQQDTKSKRSAYSGSVAASIASGWLQSYGNETATVEAARAVNLQIQSSASSIHLSLGLPTSTPQDSLNPNSYLLVKPEYVLSYNNTLGTLNWAAWQLSQSWLGSTPRQDDFREDITLPAEFVRASAADYVGSGFDRGHIVASADRTASTEMNSATFLMSNIIPQAPLVNRGPWADFEDYLRGLSIDHELYLYAGVLGTGGVGSIGYKASIGPGITVPEYVWKVALVVDTGETPDQIGADDWAVAVLMPNSDNLIAGTQWNDWTLSVDNLELSTGYDFFQVLSSSVETAIEERSRHNLTRNVFFNELHYDNIGADANEAYEIAGIAGLNLSGWKVAFYNGETGSVYRTDALTGIIPDQSLGYGTIAFYGDSIQNGPSDGLALISSQGDVVDFISYEGTIAAVSGPAAGLTSIDIGVSETSSTPLGASLQRSGVGDSVSDFTWIAASNSSFGAINISQVFF